MIWRKDYEPKGILTGSTTGCSWWGSALDGRFQGCVVNSLHQVTSTNPIKFSLTLSKSNETFKAVEGGGEFCRHGAV